MAIERRTGRGGAIALACLPLLTGCGSAEPEAQTAALAVGCVPRACYYDGDGDGYGVLPPTYGCGGCGEGAAESAGDCDDSSDAVHPRRSESAANGVDDDCDGQIDEATFQGPPYWLTGGAPTDDPARPFLRLNNDPETAQARQAGVLYGRVYYRKLAEASAPYQATPFQPAELYDDGYSVYAGFEIDDLAPLAAYEMRVDLYRRQVTLPGSPLPFSYVRLAPHGGCQGDSNSTPACSNSEVEYVIARSAADLGPLSQARAAVVQKALGQKDISDLGLPGAGNDSQFYAASAQHILSDLDPSTHTSEAALQSWFSAYAALSDGAGHDLAALRPGDWLSVDDDATPRQTGGRTRMFLAHDAPAGAYWFVEGDGRRETPWGPVLHSVRVAAAERCLDVAPDGAACANPAGGPCAPGCDPVRQVGALKKAAVLNLNFAPTRPLRRAHAVLQSRGERPRIAKAARPERMAIMKRLVSSAACALALTAGAGLAHADSRCNDFSIIVENDFTGVDGIPNEIKVFDLSYWDDEDGTWRQESTGNETINYGSSETWTKGLESVGGEYGVVVRVHYRVFFNGSWGADRTKDSVAFRCIDHDSVRVVIN